MIKSVFAGIGKYSRTRQRLNPQPWLSERRAFILGVGAARPIVLESGQEVVPLWLGGVWGMGQERMAVSGTEPAAGGAMRPSVGRRRGGPELEVASGFVIGKILPGGGRGQGNPKL